MPAIQKLRELQKLPLDLKVKTTQQRIREWVEYYGEDNVYVSFSGGKDSTVLLNIVRDMYPSIKAVFFDTGLEFPEIREFVKSFENVDWLKPDMNFRDVIISYGYPFISKEVAGIIYGARKALKILIEQEQDLFNIGNIEDIVNSKKLIEIVDKRQSEPGVRYVANVLNMIQKDGTITINGNKETVSPYNIGKYKFLLSAPFEINSRCCEIMKKNLSHRYIKATRKIPITGQMAYESELRKQQWIRNGCNGFDMAEPRSNPMSFWVEQDVLEYIKNNNIKIASVYGDIITTQDSKTKCDVLTTTACSRTGCIFCGFGSHHERRPSRFELINIVSNPNLSDYVLRGGCFGDDGLWRPSSEGLGYWFVAQYINIHGHFSMYIPDYEIYEMKYGNDQTNKYLYEHLL